MAYQASQSFGPRPSDPLLVNVLPTLLHYILEEEEKKAWWHLNQGAVS